MMEQIKEEPEDYDVAETKLYVDEFIQADVKEELNGVDLNVDNVKTEMQVEDAKSVRMLLNQEANKEENGSCIPLFSDVNNTHFKTDTIQEKQFICDLCNKIFNQESNWSSHSCLNSEENSVACSIGENSSVYTSELLSDVLEKALECNIRKPYMCNICNKLFYAKTHLVIHTRVHTNEKPYTCNTCNKSFSTKAGLLRHIRVQPAEKTYICNFCNKSFSFKSSLSRHTQTHTLVKPYSCDICNKLFSDKCNVVRHKLIHTEELYKCDICKKSFRGKSNLDRHVRIHI